MITQSEIESALKDIWDRMLVSHRQESLDRAIDDALRRGKGFVRIDAEGAHYIPYSDVVDS